MSDIGKPFPPAKRGEYVGVGDIVVATDGADAMRGIVKRVNLDRAVPQATVKWDSGATRQHTLAMLRKAVNVSGGFRHTSLTALPEVVEGITFLDEEPGFTGIYLRAPGGGLWPARTVDQSLPKHHADVLAAWRECPGKHIDLRRK